MLLEFPRVAILLLTASLWPVTRVSKTDHDHLGDAVIEDRTHIRVGCSSLSEFCSALRSGQKVLNLVTLHRLRFSVCLSLLSLSTTNNHSWPTLCVCVSCQYHWEMERVHGCAW